MEQTNNQPVSIVPTEVPTTGQPEETPSEQPITPPDGTANEAPASPTDKVGETRQLGNKELLETVIALLTTGTLTDAARKLEVNRNTIYNRKEKWHIDELIAEIPMQALQALQGSSLKAAMNMTEELDSYRPKIRQDAGKYILDKSIPQQATTQVNIQKNVMGMSDFVAAIKQRRTERANSREGVPPAPPSSHD